MEACTCTQLEEENNEAVTRASSYGVTCEEPRVQEHIARRARTRTLACTQPSLRASKRSRQQKEGRGDCVCMNVLVLPEVSLLSSDLIPFLAATVEK